MATPADTLDFPQFAQAENAWNIAFNSMAAGSTTGGNYPIVMTDGGGLWAAKISKIRIRSVNDVLTYRAARLIADGGSQPLVVYRNEIQIKPATYTTGIPHSDGSLFSDGSGFSQENELITFNADAALRATTVQLNINYGVLSAGNCFSVYTATQGWRLYEIRRIFPVSGTVWNAEIRPPLREAVSAGTLLESALPRCTMRLDQSSDMDFTLTRIPYPDQSANFVELLF